METTTVAGIDVEKAIVMETIIRMEAVIVMETVTGAGAAIDRKSVVAATITY